MKLSDFFVYLANGEFSQYAVSVLTDGEITDKNYPKVLTYINLGLTQLHSRLNLRMEQLLLQTNQYQKRYTLHSNFAQSTAATNVQLQERYILDMNIPFNNNILTVTKVVREEEDPLPLNDHSVEDAVFLPKPYELQFTQPKDKKVAVIYRANHELLPIRRDIDPDNIELDIPDFCIEPLMMFCLSRLLGTGGNAESLQEKNICLGHYERHLLNLSNSGLLVSDFDSHNRIAQEGWA